MSREVPAAVAAMSESLSGVQSVSAADNVLVGGTGRQRLTGGDADDVIYADRRPDDATPRLLLQDGARDAGFGALSAPTLAAAAQLDGRVLFFGADATRGYGGVAGWEVDAEDGLVAVWSQSALFYLEPVLTGARAVHAARHDGDAWLITGGRGLSLSRIDDATGRPELMDTVRAGWGDGLDKPGAFAAWSDSPEGSGGDLTILVGGWTAGGLSRYVWDGEALSLAERIPDSYDQRLSKVAAIETVSFGADRFVLTLSSEDAGLTVWRAGTEGLAETDRRGPEDEETGFDLWGATSLAVVERIGFSLIYAAAETGVMVCWRLSADGTLTRLHSRSDISNLTHMRIGAADMLLVTDGEEEVRLMRIGVDGALSVDAEVNLGEGARIGALSAAPFENSALMMAARPDEGGFDLIEFAADGDDLVYAGGGADEIRGGGGRDRLYGQGGADSLFGEDDDDFMLGGGADDLLDGGDGDDELRGGADDDRLIGGDGADLLKGGNGRDVLDGGAGDDDLRGGMLADQISGGAGADRILAGFGHDTARGGAGADEIYGHWGLDALYGGGGDDWIGGGNGHDRIWGEAGDDDLRGALGDDELRGGDGSDTLRGGGHKDRLFGGADDDFLFGDEGADQLKGGDGADQLNGGTGGDDLWGGDGADILVGGGGADRFHFDAADGRDMILDFKDGVDRIVYDAGPRGFDALAIEDGAQGAVIHRGAPLLESVTLVGVAAEDLTAADFLFG